MIDINNMNREELIHLLDGIRTGKISPPMQPDTYLLADRKVYKNEPTNYITPDEFKKAINKTTTVIIAGDLNSEFVECLQGTRKIFVGDIETGKILLKLIYKLKNGK